MVSLLFTLVITATTLPISNLPFGESGWLYFIYGCTCTMGLVYVIVMMKETMGVSEEKVKRLYRKDNLTYGNI